jgi:hypothetical protein
MNTKYLSALLLMGSWLWIVSCQNELRQPAGSLPVVPTADAAKDGDEHQEYLTELWNKGRSYTFVDVISVTFDPKYGCNETAVPGPWEGFSQYEFGLYIAPNAIDPDQFATVSITISVPNLESITYSLTTTQSMPIEYTVQTDPEGFIATIDPPAVLTFAFHPRLRPSCGSYCFFGLSEVEGNPPTYVVTDPQTITLAPKRLELPEIPIVDPIVACATGLQAEFSGFGVTRPDRWEVANGCCGRDGGPIDTPCDWTD